MHIQVLTPSRYNAGHRTRTGITLRVFLQHVRLDRESARSGLISLVWGKNRENYSETPILDIKKRGGRQIIPMTISSQEASRMKVEHPTPMMGSQRSSCTWGSINIGHGSLAQHLEITGQKRHWWDFLMKNWVQAWPYQERPLAKTRAGFTPGTNPF